MQKARRYIDGKIRYELIPPNFLKELAKVYTIGADKYTIRNENGEIIDDGADNWRKGLSWKNTLGSIFRHLEKFKDGEDFDYDYPKEQLDKYGPSYHLANAAWGLATLLEYYKSHPELDDRNHMYLSTKKIGIDIDGVIADFNGAIATMIGKEGHEPADWQDPHVTKAFESVKTNPEFWSNLKPLVKVSDIPFEAHCYITSRSIDYDCTKKWLHDNGFPDVPLYCVGSGESKVDVAKNSGIDYFIDDYYKNFIELNNAGICTFLIDRSWNRRYDVGYRRIKDFNDFKERFL